MQENSLIQKGKKIKNKKKNRKKKQKPLMFTQMLRFVLSINSKSKKQ